MHEYVCNEANQKYYGGWLGNLRRYTQNWLKRQMLKQVHELDDYLIKDLGMNRQEIADVLQLSLDFDPILELHRRSRAKVKKGWRQSGLANPSCARAGASAALGQLKP